MEVAISGKVLICRSKLDGRSEELTNSDFCTRFNYGIGMKVIPQLMSSGEI